MEESERIQALVDYNILDTLPEKEFDDIVEIAAALFGVKISLIGLIDSKRQWYKAKVGVEGSEVPVDSTFCKYAIQSPDTIMVVEDASADHRFKDHPMVTGSPNIRFYASAPLISPSGYVLGTLCVIDDQPRTILEEHKKLLKLLAQRVIHHLESRKESLNASKELHSIMNDLTQIRTRLEHAEKTANLGSWEWKVSNELYCSDEVYTLFGFQMTERPITIEKWKMHVYPDDTQGLSDTFKDAIITGMMQPVQTRILRPNGEVRWLKIVGSPIISNGVVSSLHGIILDITARKRQETDRMKYIDTLEQMLFSLSHKIRKPVASTLGLASLFESKTLSLQDLEKHLSQFVHAAHELDGYIRELTHFLSTIHGEIKK